VTNAYHSPRDLAAALWPNLADAGWSEALFAWAVETIYLASMTVEEGHPTRLTFVLADPSQMKRLGNAVGIGRLSEPVPLSIDAARKLSSIGPAVPVVVECRADCVSIAALSCHPPELEPMLHLRIDGPGQIAGLVEGHLIAVLQRGVLTQVEAGAPRENSANEVWDEWLLPLHHAVFERATDLTNQREGNEWAYRSWSKTFRQLEEEDKPVVLKPVLRYTNRLLHDFGSTHGGCLVLLPLDGSRSLQRLTLTYAMQGWSTVDLLAIDCLRRLEWATAITGYSERVIDEERHLDVMFDAIIALGNPDGALVLDQHLNVHAFGVRIEAPELDAAQIEGLVHFDPYGRRVDHDWLSFGTRHQAAIRLAAHDPELLILAASHDHQARVIKGMDGTAVSWRVR
jgi:hypothetical protein